MNWIQFAWQAQQPGPPNLSFLLVLLAMFAMFYFVLIRPQRKKQKETKEMVNALKKGDRVVTSGGIFGTIAGVHDSIVVLKIAEDVKIEVLKGAVANIIHDKPAS
ncbi:MAG: preprotein translocase subunit YajC [bacterium]|nr:preprotein translocase subunit YajC [bacterium]